MHLVRVSSQLLVSVLFIALPTKIETLNFFYICCVLFLAKMQSYSHAHTIENMVHRQTMIWWLDYIKCILLLFVLIFH